MAKIENHQYTIEEAFRDCFYVIPDYQREYVWEDKEVSKLLEDINDEMDNTSTSQYFIGTILVSPREQKNHYDVIDGQQRLTTFYLILCALRALFKNQPQEQMLNGLIATNYTDQYGEIITSPKLSPRYENAETIMQAIVESQNTPEIIESIVRNKGVKNYGSLKNLINAYNTVYEFIKSNYQENGLLKRYWGYLSYSVIFIQISTDVSRALKIFETINERGVGLNPMDLLKNLLFTNVKQEQFTQLKDEWKKITNPLDKNKKKPLRFLRYFLMANYTIINKRNESIVREDEIYEWFTQKDVGEHCNYKSEPFVFVRKVIRNVNNYIDFANGKGNDGKENVYMKNIQLLAGGSFSLHYILLLSSYNFPKDLFDYFLQQIEVFLFYYIFTKTPTKELERNFSKWSDELREISELVHYEEQKSRLNDFVDKNFIGSIAKKQSELVDSLKRYHLKTLQQYRTRYILAKIAQYVDMAYKGLRQPGNLDELTNLEIEHILPNNPKQELLDDFVMNNPEKDYEEYKVKLGNLTLLEKPLNIIAGRKFFDEKKDEYTKSTTYLTRSIVNLVSAGNNSSINRINENLKSFDEWTAQSIDARQSMLIELALKIWKITLLEN